MSNMVIVVGIWQAEFFDHAGLGESKRAFRTDQPREVADEVIPVTTGSYEFYRGGKEYVQDATIPSDAIRALESLKDGEIVRTCSDCGADQESQTAETCEFCGGECHDVRVFSDGSQEEL